MEKIMQTVSEVSKLTGISVRTLHHYDAIGLLKPTKITEAGYRLYDNTALDRLLHILMFRELQIPLKEIKSILDSPDFNPGEAIEQQIHLLELQLKHTKELISFARTIQKGGVHAMNFKAFDKTEIDQYAKEVKEKWGNTQAYKEYEKKRKGNQTTNLKKMQNSFPACLPKSVPSATCRLPTRQYKNKLRNCRISLQIIITIVPTKF